MDTKNLIKYLLLDSSSETANVDVFANDVELLIAGDRRVESRGLPFYRDYSKNHYKVKTRQGTALTSAITVQDISFPAFQASPGVSVEQFIRIPNGDNNLLRVGELNQQQRFSDVLPSYLDVESRNIPLNLPDEFTIELSFYADSLSLFRDKSLQCVFTVGNSLRHTATVFFPSDPANYSNFVNDAGYGLYLIQRDLFFVIRNNSYKINISQLNPNQWYTAAIQRKNGNISTYLDSVKTASYTNNTFITFPTTTNGATGSHRLRIGANPLVYYVFNNTQSLSTPIDTSFSGGISNFRITAKRRYNQDFYPLLLPFPSTSYDYPVDSLAASVKLNMPLESDLYDYSSSLAHIANRELLKRVINYNTEYLNLDNTNLYKTETLTGTLNNNWSLQFYMIPTANGNVLQRSRTLAQYFFSDFDIESNAPGINSTFESEHTLLKLKAGDGTVFDIKFHSHIAKRFNNYSRRQVYFSFGASSNGTSYVEINDDPINLRTTTDTYFLPTTRCYFAYDREGTSTVAGMNLFNTEVRGVASEPNGIHVTVERFSNTLFFYFNGVLMKSVPFNTELYSTGDLSFQLGEVITQLTGSGSEGLASLTWSIKGLRFTNGGTRFVSNVTNEYVQSHSIHPLALASGNIVPPRFRVLGIVKELQDFSTDLDEVVWYVYLSQPCSTLTEDDFTLTQLDGVIGAEITEIEKTSEYEYKVTASTGDEDGQLRLNFLDRNVLTYKNSSKLVSNYAGELNFEGETYSINKSSPIPILSSSASPYVLGAFSATVTFNSAISVFDPSKLGVVNGKISQLKLIDELTRTYSFTVTPIRTEPVIVQAVPGLGITAGGKISTASEPLVRVFSNSYSILQLPLTVASFLNDCSPARLTMSEVVANNTDYVADIAPSPELSSLNVVPFAEQSGLTYTPFNQVASLIDLPSTELDWTIEFFARLNTSSSKQTHILSIEDPNNAGLSIFARNGNIVIQRTASNPSAILNIPVSERETPSYVEWDDPLYTNRQKFPHFALTKQGNTYRLYRNGTRRGIIQSTTPIRVHTGNRVVVGHYPTRVADEPYQLSNVRITLGRALYTSATFSVPLLPFPVLPNILESASLLNYISISSNNTRSQVATEGNTVTLDFTSIIPLTTIPSVSILDRSADVVALPNNAYRASVLVTDEDSDGVAFFSIDIENEPGLPDTSFTSTTNGSSVFIDNLPLTVSISTNVPNNNRPVIPIFVTFSKEVASITRNAFTLLNCKISELSKASATEYRGTLAANSSGTFSIQLEEGAVQSLSGAFNEDSNVLSRNAVVPAYVPDPYWENVICFITPTEFTIQDESANNCSITNFGTNIVTDTSPLAIPRSMHFTGNSSLNIDLKQSLSYNFDWTIEFYLYCSTSTRLKLPAPQALPASDVGLRSFTANWSAVSGAEGYVIDLSSSSNFESYIYRGVLVTDTSLAINPLNSSQGVAGVSTVAVGSSGFVASWRGVNNPDAYAVQVALDPFMLSPLAYYDNLLILNNQIQVGSLDDAEYVSSLSIPEGFPLDLPGFDTSSGVLLTGVLADTEQAALYYVLEESTIRAYQDNDFYNPLYGEDVEIKAWNHIAITNSRRKTKLWVNGVLEDSVPSMAFNSELVLGYKISHFSGYMAGFRVTKGIARYTEEFDSPILPYSKF